MNVLEILEGNCRNGEHCTFAHGPEDLREPPPNWQEIVGAREKDKGLGNWNDDQRTVHKMKICKRFYNGEECPYGDKCNFLHEQKFKTEMGSSRESSAISIGTTGSMVENRSVSTYLQSLTIRLEEMRIKRRDSEQWMHHRLLPQDLRERVRRYDQYKWLETRGVDEHNIVQSLPKDLRRDIKRHLCLALVKRVISFFLYCVCL
ncbi:putative cyclic nucleotide-gated ion channel 5 [Camellia lanceoleosa]|uniref:Cyclic nucleotide-gated ion channel 5 n=1 Tax=Camellia lanceoleosa TaxID=1840588 RepID=A0ACC0IE14_9ERIC|nr:putative cyclic nucleotide-gated ion channel 5 [Camellia lanceoleosa]